jgi:hypothetical protein
MKLGIPVYEGVNLLDVAGPLEMFSWVDKKKGLETVLLSIDGKPVTSLNGVRFDAQASFAATPRLDILWVPGGAPDALGAIMSDPASPYSRLPATGCGQCEMGLLGLRRCAAAGSGRAAGRPQGHHTLGVCRLPAPLSCNQGSQGPSALRRVGQPAYRRRHIFRSRRSAASHRAAFQRQDRNRSPGDDPVLSGASG